MKVFLAPYDGALYEALKKVNCEVVVHRSPTKREAQTYFRELRACNMGVFQRASLLIHEREDVMIAVGLLIGAGAPVAEYLGPGGLVESPLNIPGMSTVYTVEALWSWLSGVAAQRARG